MFFLLAFWLRTQTAGTAWFGAAIGLSALGTMAGNAIAPRHPARAARGADARRRARPVGASAGVAAALTRRRRPPACCWPSSSTSPAAIGRLAFESIVQRDAPEANRGRAFARFETRFQLAWAIAGLIPVLISIPGPIGFLIVGLICAAALVNYVVGQRSMTVGRGRRLSRPAPLPPPPPPR